MPLPAYDSDKHHVGIGVDTASLYGFLLTGSYDRQLQQFAPPTDFGGERDVLSAPQLSRWTQDDFTGGSYQYTWKDPAMFASSLNVLPSQRDRSLRTVPPLVPVNQSLGMSGEAPLYVFASDGFVFAVFQTKVKKVEINTGNVYQTFDIASGVGEDYVTAASFDRKQKILWVAFRSDGGGAANRVYRYAVHPTIIADSSAPYWDGPSGNTRYATWLDWNGQKLVACFDNRLYFATNDQDDLTPTWTGNIRLPGRLADGEWYNGELYIVTYDSEMRGQLVKWDGTAILPLTDFPYNFRPRRIVSYGGRIFVGGSGRDIQGNERYAQLFEVTGASLRLVKSWDYERSAITAMQSRPTTIYDLCVHEGLLFFGDTGRSLVAYDLTTDSFYGGPLLHIADGVRQVRWLLSTRQQLVAYVIHPLDSAQDGIYRVAATDAELEANVADGFYGELVTSDFAPEADRDKRWSELKVWTRNGEAEVAYSLASGYPGGDTFTELPVTTTQEGSNFYTVADLSAVTCGPQIRIRIRLPRGNDTSTYTELVAYTLSFLMLETGKQTWSMMVNGTSRIETLDGDVQLYAVRDIRRKLFEWIRERTPLVFRDVDGDDYNVQVAALRERQPAIAAKAEYFDPNTGETEQAHEGFYSLTLVEV